MAKASKKAKIIAAILASVTGVAGISGTMVASGILAYEAFFPRFNRPDYAVTPGVYCYDRISHKLNREEFFYQSKDAKLKGYYYESEEKKGLVVLAHGFKSGADDYLPLIAYIVESGYNVFTYNCTGVYESEGDGMIGMCQSLVDLDYTLKFIEKEEKYSSQPLFLIGHSWGGYAVTAVLEFHKQVKACVAIAPMNNGSTIMLEKGKEYAGPLALTPTPIFTTYQKILFKKYSKSSGVKGINSTTAPVLIAHGIDDKVITYTEQSIVAHKKEITNPNVIYYDGYGANGDHVGIWHSEKSFLYQMEVESRLKEKENQKGSALTYEEKVEFYKTVDHERYSEVNPVLGQMIKDLFDAQIS